MSRFREYLRDELEAANNRLGDVARKIADDPDFPDGPYSEMRRYLEHRGVPGRILDAFDDAYDAFEREHGAHGLASGRRVWWADR